MICKIIIIILTVFICIFSLDMKQAYPCFMIQLFCEPYVRFTSYIILYILARFNITIALLYMSALILFHIDYMNLTIFYI